MKKITMQCADEGLAERTFVRTGELSAGRADYTCEQCGWSQESTAGGCYELCLYSTWHSLDECRMYAEIARSGGFEVPDNPPHFEEAAQLKN